MSNANVELTTDQRLDRLHERINEEKYWRTATRRRDRWWQAAVIVLLISNLWVVGDLRAGRGRTRDNIIQAKVAAEASARLLELLEPCFTDQNSECARLSRDARDQQNMKLVTDIKQIVCLISPNARAIEGFCPPSVEP